MSMRITEPVGGWAGAFTRSGMPGTRTSPPPPAERRAARRVLREVQNAFVRPGLWACRPPAPANRNEEERPQELGLAIGPDECECHWAKQWGHRKLPPIGNRPEKCRTH